MQHRTQGMLEPTTPGMVWTRAVVARSAGQVAGSLASSCTCTTPPIVADSLQLGLQFTRAVAPLGSEVVNTRVLPPVRASAACPSNAT